MDEYANPKITTAVYHSDATAGFTAQDWIDLAMAALDQAGLSASERKRVEDVLAESDGVGVCGLSAEEATLPFCACGHVVSRCDGSRLACNSKRLAMIAAGDKADNRRGA